jgi:DNA-directed RNA polymerase specialized sigma24 family protein
VGVSRRQPQSVPQVKKRRRWSESVHEDAFPDDIAAFEPRFDPGCLQKLLTKHKISAGCSAVLTLHFQEDLTLAEVGAVLELPLGTVKSRLAYGLAALRKRLGNARSL